MRIQIRVAGQDADQELRSLYAWLLEDSDLRRQAQASLVVTEPQPAEMGGALELIQLVVDSGFQALSLALAYASWRATRPSRPQVTIERDGVNITLDDAEPDAVEAIVRGLS